MPPFQTVHGGRAGPRAVGILVPPGSRTLVVVRPRALSVDLVMERAGQTQREFMEVSRQAAGIEAQKLTLALVSWAGGGPGRMATVAVPEGGGFWLHAEVGPYSLMVCPRVPGQPYRPLVYASLDDARQAADALQSSLCPAPDANQELYTNLSGFGRLG